MVNEPLRLAIVPSSTTVTFSWAIFCPIRLWNAEVFFLLKSPSKPCPIASCKIIPGHPGPNTTFISPAGAGLLSILTSACLIASSQIFFQFSLLKYCS